MVKFQDVDGFEENDYGVSSSSVLKASECEGGCSGGFCVDKNGYLVSVKAISTSPLVQVCVSSWGVELRVGANGSYG